ncbi:MAG: hypothetical protein R3C08_07215 [Hyphomonas sp.]|nr:hypothetical protein [Hyphomonas sp.]HRX74658.1 hypothetical protein [Hyphomonas sp.]
MRKLVSLAMTGLLAAALPAAADLLVSPGTVEKVVSMEYEDGSTETEYVPTEAVEHGEELAYVVSFRNEGAEPADGVVVAVPVPQDMVYVEDSVIADDASVDFSVDGGKSFAPREGLLVEDGETTRQAYAAEITHVRWTFTRVVPGEEGMLAFHAVLN